MTSRCSCALPAARDGFIDLYPTIYSGRITGPGSPAAATVNGYFLLPMLNLADHPGEQLPAFHLAFRVRS